MWRFARASLVVLVGLASSAVADDITFDLGDIQVGSSGGGSLVVVFDGVMYFGCVDDVGVTY